MAEVAVTGKDFPPRFDEIRLRNITDKSPDYDVARNFN
jgi:hypothetical protein